VTISPTVVIPAFRRIEASRRALASLRTAGASRILFVDDGGSAGGEGLKAEFPEIEVIRTDRPVWWTGGIVLGVERALSRGDSWILFFNQDVTAAPDYFEKLGEAAARFPGALIGSAVLYAQEPERVWSAGGAIEWWGRGIRGLYHGEPAAALPAEPFEADWLFGMGTLVPAAVFAKIGLPDGVRFPLSWGDADFSLRAREAGLHLLVEPKARLFHEVGAYDPFASGPPSARQYVEWMRDEKHNLSLSAHAELWKRHGPKFLWPLSLALRIGILLLNYFRIKMLFSKVEER
jgi:GT2 family glycosyltransferase